MPVQSSVIENLFRQRTTLIGKLSQENAEHLRLLQLVSGIEILEMKDPENPQFIRNKSETDIKVASNLACMKKLEGELEQIDKRIEIALNEEA